MVASGGDGVIVRVVVVANKMIVTLTDKIGNCGDGSDEGHRNSASCGGA